MVKVPKLKLDSYQPLRDVIFETLRKAIISGDIKPGERLMEVPWPNRWASRPVREATEDWRPKAWLTWYPVRDTCFRAFSKDIIDVLEVRGLLTSWLHALLQNV